MSLNKTPPYDRLSKYLGSRMLQVHHIVERTIVLSESTLFALANVFP